MPKRFQNALQDFSAGVLSPRLATSVNTEAFSHSLRTGKNFFISSQGGAAFRHGGQYLGKALSNQPFRLFQFHRGGDESDLLLEVGEGSIRFWTDTTGTPEPLVDNVTVLTDEDDGEFLTDENGVFLTVGTVIVDNPYTLEQLEDLYFTNQGKYGVLTHEAHPPYYITARADGSILTELLALSRIPEYIYNDVDSPRIVSEAGDWQVSFPASWLNSGFAFFMSYNGVVAGPIGQIYTFDPTDATVGETNVNAISIRDGLLAAIAKLGWTTGVVVNAVDVLTYTVDFTGENSGYPMTVTPSYGAVFIPIAMPPLAQPLAGTNSDEVTELAWSYPLYVLHNGVYYQCIQTHRAVADTEPGVGVNWELYWRDLGISKPVGWDYQYPNGSDWVLDAPAPDQSVYSPLDRGFPTVCVFHEQRLILMANPDNPTALYGSALGDYFNFTPGPNDDQPFLFVLDSSDTPQIKWARSQRLLTLGTSSGEWAVTATVTITPTDIDAEQQNNARSELALPVQIDTEIFYIEQGRRKIRTTQYADERKTFQSSDVSLLAEHLVSTHGVGRIAVSFIPEVLLTMVRDNGQPIFMTYEKSKPVVAFTEMETDGTVNDAASFFSHPNHRDYVFFAVERNGEWTLERMRYPCSKLCTGLLNEGAAYLDSWVSGIVDGDVITGLEHLEGKTVYVIVDEAWQIGDYVVNNGQITLPRSFNSGQYVVGLPYVGELETFETAENFRGTSLGTKRRWNRLTTRVLNSSLPLVYTERASDRRPSTPMAEADAAVSGLRDIEQSVAGYTDGSILVIQDRPYPLYILGFFGEYQVEDR